MDYELRSMFQDRGLSDQIDRIMPWTVLSVHRLKGLIRAIDGSPQHGATAEIGCLAGGASRLIALLNGHRRHFVCDTFGGLVDCGGFDTTLENGDFNCRRSPQENLQHVTALMADLANVAIVAGYFPESATEEMRSSQYAMVHIDCDTYQSMRSSFEFFIDRMNPGGIIILDDVVGQKGAPGAMRAWEEIVDMHGQSFSVIEENAPQMIIKAPIRRRK